MLQAPACPICGHRFRTIFVEPPVERTEAFTLMVVPPVAPPPPRRSGAARSFRLAFLSGCLLVALAGGLFFLVWSTRQPQAAVSVPVAAPAVAGQAVRLYRTVKPMMSLYDLDKAAGGTGRVIRASDPHRLLISYDYPPQSVQVLLSRTDLTGSDYQVQSVSLYQGKTLLRRHAEME